MIFKIIKNLRNTMNLLIDILLYILIFFGYFFYNNLNKFGLSCCNVLRIYIFFILLNLLFYITNN